MGLLDLFKRRAEPVEARSSGSGYTAEIMAAREAYISGRRGIAELTATVQAAVTLWEGGLGLADVDGTDMLDRRSLALCARSLALRGEALFLIQDRLVPCSDWELRTRNGRPTAYRVSVSEAGGGRTFTVLAAEVLHFRIGGDMGAPWYGSAPLRRAQLTAGLLNSVETALAEIYDTAPLGSTILPYPETPETDLEQMSRGFRGHRGRVMVRESVNVAAAGGPAPAQDWKPHDLTPDLSKAMTRETLAAARDAINGVFGILPGLNSPATTGPMVREAQRHLAQWVLQPIAAMIAEEASDKLGGPVALDVMRPVQAFDTAGRARAMGAIIQALAMAKESGVDPDMALKLVNWNGDD
ncbi:Phage portal protein [Rhodobacteraceae bacterium THAF1]|uniref:phage portal protein n=1 Tax=Palleronia sp. THAF1 TaxID=2587842 RepID=UPI000F3D3668|nr:phage portal protein [Palleronia sp. THAF1]QFU07287.1 Phage portal protein [Palleronia sp. THAF1]VDC20801.1 Phage portal protein [Rhodobacteraceae bacterium THAF1]